jgi:hypothetical protein
MTGVAGPRATRRPPSASVVRPVAWASRVAHSAVRSSTWSAGRVQATGGVGVTASAGGSTRQAQVGSQAPSAAGPARWAAAVRSWSEKAVSSTSRAWVAATLAVTSSWNRRCTGPQASVSHTSTRSRISSRVHPSCLARAMKDSRVTVPSS